jgi:hypothetical protein
MTPSSEPLKMTIDFKEPSNFSKPSPNKMINFKTQYKLSDPTQSNSSTPSKTNSKSKSSNSKTKTPNSETSSKNPNYQLTLK